MKLMHISDLHIGKRLNDFSLLEDQEFILLRVIEIIKDQNPDALIIAGDVYDKSVPGAEAVTLFDKFLVMLSELGTRVFIICGNHDSPERIAYASKLIEKTGIYISPVYSGSVEPIVLSDEHGSVSFYMLPFIKPGNVRRFFPDAEVGSYPEAMRTAIDAMGADFSQRNVLIAHQFVTGSSRTESEEISVGGLDNIDAELFDGFDYVALGHLHRPQFCSRPQVRYSGSILKYSFSEANDQKSASMVELGPKGIVNVSTVPLVPRRELSELRGRYDELTLKSFYDGAPFRDNYLRITLTDEDDIPEALAKLRVIYKNLMSLRYDNTRTRHSHEFTDGADTENKTPLELFGDFYRLQNGTDATEAQLAIVSECISTIWED